MNKFIGCPDSNFRRGRPIGSRPEAIVIHIIDGNFAAGESVFRDPTSQKSAHYGISPDGTVHQYVDENDTAFHAGILVNPSWDLLKPRVNPNFYTIGIEHEGGPDDRWPEAQLEASATLVARIALRWEIELDDSHVIRHHQIRASKACPENWLKIGEILKRSPTRLALSAAAAATTTSSPFSIDITMVEAPRSEAATPEPVISVPETVKTVPKMMVVRTIGNVNLRSARPSLSARLVRVIPAHTDVAARFEIGEAIEANAFWYVDVQDNYFWAGATNAPDRTLLAA
jgi:N-acetylmuramoyl-L-alanine amidase CwlA